jgi:hypothetical protein
LRGNARREIWRIGTFSQFPLLEIGPDEFIVLRPAWVLDRFAVRNCTGETFASFGFEKDERGEQFSQAMNYVFEANVGYVFRRVTRRARPTIITLIKQMQQAWKTGQGPPSVCDWVLASGKHCLLVDATNHWLDEKAAQGFADADEDQVDVEDAFVNKKFKQLKSSIELLDAETIYVPLVVVPNAGIPAAVFADIDMKMRGHPVFGQLGKNVTLPGILIWHELQVFEAYVNIASHRHSSTCSRSGESNAPPRFRCGPRRFLPRRDRPPVGSRPIFARSQLMKALQ